MATESCRSIGLFQIKNFSRDAEIHNNGIFTGYFASHKISLHPLVLVMRIGVEGTVSPLFRHALTAIAEEEMLLYFTASGNQKCAVNAQHVTYILPEGDGVRIHFIGSNGRGSTIYVQDAFEFVCDEIARMLKVVSLKTP